MIFFVNAMLFFAAPQVDLITKAVHYLPQQVAVTLQANINRILQQEAPSGWLSVLLPPCGQPPRGHDADPVHGLRLLWRQDKQSYIKVKIKSLIFTMLISFAMILSLGLIVFGNAVVYAIATTSMWRMYFLKCGRWPSSASRS